MGSADRPRDPFIAEVLHDLKNVLAAQSMLLAAMQAHRCRCPEPRSGDSLTLVQYTATQAAGLVRLLALDALESGARTSVGFRTLVDLALGALGPDLSERFTVTSDVAVDNAGPMPAAQDIVRPLTRFFRQIAMILPSHPGSIARVAIGSADAPSRTTIAIEHDGASIDLVDAWHAGGAHGLEEQFRTVGGTITLPERSVIALDLPPSALGLMPTHE